MKQTRIQTTPVTEPTLPLPLSEDAAASSLVAVGERFELSTRYSRDEISNFATLTHDSNPVHHDRGAAQRAGLADVIASGQHTSALMSGLAASYFSRSDDGVQRNMLCLNFNFAYRAPIFAEHEVRLEWEVCETEWSASLGGVIAQIEGRALVVGALAVVARGTVLVRHAS